jgi:hypothetical protein
MKKKPLKATDHTSGIASPVMTADLGHELSPAAQEQIELTAIAGALNFLDQVDREAQRPRRLRSWLIALVNALTRRGGPLIWQWGSWGQLHPYPAGAPFTEEYCDWTEGRQMFESHGDPDIHWRLLCKDRPVTIWRPPDLVRHPGPAERREPVKRLRKAPRQQKSPALTMTAADSGISCTPAEPGPTPVRASGSWQSCPACDGKTPGSCLTCEGAGVVFAARPALAGPAAATG